MNENLKSKFYPTYESVSKYVDQKYVLPFWVDINFRLSNHFMPFPPDNFLSHQDITNTMFSHNTDWASKQLDFLETQYNNNELCLLLQEQQIGKPAILFEKYKASCNTIHHLYHMHKMRTKLKTSFNSIIEIGGGYGRLFLTLSKLYPTLKTYTIIDLPIFTAIQWFYLSSIFGEEHINVVERHNSNIKEDHINLVPIGFMDNILPQLQNNDLLIGMWSMSETTPDFVELMKNTDFLNSKNVFGGFHSYEDKVLPSGKLLFDLLKPNIEETNFVAGHYYGWK